jgi:tRNA(Ile)-lysidine synthetase-like protein
VRRHGDRLYAASTPQTPARPATPSAAPKAGKAHPDRLAARIWRWRRERRLVLPGGAWIELIPDRHGGLLRTALPEQLEVAFRSLDGRVAGLPGGQLLKRLLQSVGLPPWQRAEVPLIYARRRLIAVGDWWQAPEVCAQPEAAAGGRNPGRLRLRWHAAGH